MSEESTDPPMQSVVTSRFVGWHRANRHERWQPVAEADTEDVAFDALLDARLGGDKVVLPRGVDPNAKRRAGGR